MPGLLPLCQEGEKHDDGWGPSTQPSYHLVRINQSCTLTRWHRAGGEWQHLPQAEGQALNGAAPRHLNVPWRHI